MQRRWRLRLWGGKELTFGLDGADKGRGGGGGGEAAVGGERCVLHAGCGRQLLPKCERDVATELEERSGPAGSVADESEQPT
eukprot:539180-Hanusia_phi.AAC.1